TMVEPDTDGNIFEFTADAQSHIVLKPHGARDRASDKAGHLVGQPDHPGLASVMRWVVRDPIRPHEPFPARRHRLDVAGRALQPGPGKKCPDRARPARAARHLGGRVNEWWPSIALGPGREVTVAWGDDSTGVQRAYFARSTDGGRTFGAARALDPASPAGVAQWRPVFAQGPGGT